MLSLERTIKDNKERFRRRSAFSTILFVCAPAAIVLLWARLLEHTGTFLGILGAGLAIALREPLLSIAGRILQIPNSQVFGTPIFNYTQTFSYIWDEIKLPITYSSNFERTSQILREAGGEYTREFLAGAQSQLEPMRQYFVIPAMETQPEVFLRVTDNWLELSMRYVTDPKKRRVAAKLINRRTQLEDVARCCGKAEVCSHDATIDSRLRSSCSLDDGSHPVRGMRDNSCYDEYFLIPRLARARNGRRGRLVRIRAVGPRANSFQQPCGKNWPT